VLTLKSGYRFRFQLAASNGDRRNGFQKRIANRGRTLAVTFASLRNRSEMTGIIKQWKYNRSMPRLRRLRINSPEELRLYRHLFQTAQGFTLLELLIVIAVLGVLASVVVFAVGGIAAQSAVATCRADATSVETAVQAYNVQTGGLPTVTPILLTNSTNPYLQSFPTSTYFSISIDGLGNVLVAAPVGATPVVFGTPNACDGADKANTPNMTTTTTFNAETTTTTVSPTTTTSPTTTSTTSTSTTTSTTTSMPTATTTTLPSNGVTVVASTNKPNSFSGSESLSISNVDPITALTITIQVIQTSGLKESNMTDNFPIDLKESHKTSRGIVTYTWTLKGPSVSAGRSNDEVTALWTLSGTPHSVTGDTWSVKSTSNGSTATLSGDF
jgi:prepilin-type N-terminal cleavage/methylation domain-containing protein